jgi:hypothetical protein
MQQLYVIAHIAPAECSVGVLGVHRLILWPIKHGGPNGHHRTYGGHLFRDLTTISNTNGVSKARITNSG